MMNFLTYCDGSLDSIDIANKINVPLWEITDIIDKLHKEGIIEKSDT